MGTGSGLQASSRPAPASRPRPDTVRFLAAPSRGLPLRRQLRQHWLRPSFLCPDRLLTAVAFVIITVAPAEAPAPAVVGPAPPVTLPATSPFDQHSPTHSLIPRARLRFLCRDHFSTLSNDFNSLTPTASTGAANASRTASSSSSVHCRSI